MLRLVELGEEALELRRLFGIGQLGDLPAELLHHLIERLGVGHVWQEGQVFVPPQVELEGVEGFVAGRIGGHDLVAPPAVGELNVELVVSG